MKEKRHSLGLVVYAAVFLAICLLPFVGMAWTQLATDTSVSSEPPKPILGDGSANIEYAQQMGDYFEHNFAYRDAAIDANAHMRVGLFGVSPTDRVVVGTDGWLYYGGTLADYLGIDPMTEREADNIAFNLQLMQGYAKSKDATLVFTIGPNKNNLYPGYMPYYYLDANDTGMDTLKTALENRQVSYVDMFSLFNGEEAELYYLTDTHWNNEGALLASNALLEALGKEGAQPSAPPTTRSIEGDIETMLYPVTAQPEDSTEIETGSWAYTNSAGSVEDPVIVAQGSGEGSLLMYRDSFGNALIPLLSPEFRESNYIKLVPYNLTQIDSLKPSYVIVERAQRHVDHLAENPPIMPAPKVGASATKEQASETTASYKEDGDFITVEGWVDHAVVGRDDDIYIQLQAPSGQKAGYVPFRMSSTPSGGEVQTYRKIDNEPRDDYGFKAYLPKSGLTESEYTVTILVKKSKTADIISVGSIQMKL